MQHIGKKMEETKTDGTMEPVSAYGLGSTQNAGTHNETGRQQEMLHRGPPQSREAL